MSGGSWDYFYAKLEDVCDRLCASPVPLRRALGDRMRPFVQAMHAIEWVDSGDYGNGEEIPAIEAAIGKDVKQVVLEQTWREAVRIRDALDAAIARAIAGAMETREG